MAPILLLLSLFVTPILTQAPLDGFRPPAVPIITMDPFMNFWAMDENLYDDRVTYWNGQSKQCNGMVRVDGEVYRYMGTGGDTGADESVIQNSVKVWPTQTTYEFRDPQGRIKMEVRFTTPLLPEQWTISSRPVTYVTYTVTSNDARNHSVQVYFDWESHVAVNDDDMAIVDWRHFQINDDVGTIEGERDRIGVLRPVDCCRSLGPETNNFSTQKREKTRKTVKQGTIDVMQIGSANQSYFDISYDYDGINWGYAYIAVLVDDTVTARIGRAGDLRDQFILDGTLPPSDDTGNPKILMDNWDSLAVVWDLDVTTYEDTVKHLIAAYDDIYSIQYFGQWFRPYWRRPEANASIESLLQEAMDDYENLMEACKQFDTELVQDLTLKGGEKYATLGALAYRQTMAATKLVWNDELQTPWAFLKSISTDTDLSPLDTIAAAAPLFLYTDPSYLQALILPILAYANNETGSSTNDYPFPWAPHHLGVYPTADVLPSEQINMPMEDTGDLFILLAALMRSLGIQSTSVWYPKYWPLLKNWADYLVSTLPDPGNQVSTDTFLPPTPHDANLVLKGILGLGAFAQLCSAVGLGHERRYYNDLAESFAGQWMDLAREDDHYKLAYDQNNTWSLKYNLFYDKLLALGMFPAEVTTQEVDYYMKYQLTSYGIPLDNRVTYTKLDWMAYITALTESTIQQQDILTILYNYADFTTPFAPLADWYDALSAVELGYTARPVVGALYSLMIV